jgi:hypothetical protein
VFFLEIILSAVPLPKRREWMNCRKKGLNRRKGE